MWQPQTGTEQLEDLELLARYRSSGAPADLLPLYQRYAGFIYALCLQYLGTPERGADAGAEIWEVLCEKLPKHEVTNFKSWLHTLVRNHCLMQLRREKRDPLQQTKPGLVQSNALLHLHQEPTEGPADTRPLHACIKQLNELQRRCINLFYLREGETYQTIAEQLDLTVGKVRSHIQNGRRNLRNCLERTTHQDE